MDSETGEAKGEGRKPHPGTPHQFRTECTSCGEPGMLHVSLITQGERVEVHPVEEAATTDTDDYPEAISASQALRLDRSTLRSRAADLLAALRVYPKDGRLVLDAMEALDAALHATDVPS